MAGAIQRMYSLPRNGVNLLSTPYPKKSVKYGRALNTLHETLSYNSSAKSQVVYRLENKITWTQFREEQRV